MPSPAATDTSPPGSTSRSGGRPGSPSSRRCSRCGCPAPCAPGHRPRPPWPIAPRSARANPPADTIPSRRAERPEGLRAAALCWRQRGMSALMASLSAGQVACRPGCRSPCSPISSAGTRAAPPRSPTRRRSRCARRAAGLRRARDGPRTSGRPAALVRAGRLQFRGQLAAGHVDPADFLACLAHRGLPRGLADVDRAAERRPGAARRDQRGAVAQQDPGPPVPGHRPRQDPGGTARAPVTADVAIPETLVNRAVLMRGSLGAHSWPLAVPASLPSRRLSL